MTDRPPRPNLSFAEFLDERKRMIDALQLIADAVDALDAPPEHVRMFGVVAKRALGE